MSDPFGWACGLKSECDEYLFFLPNMNTEYYSVFGNHQTQNINYYLVLKIRIPNTKYYLVSRKSEYRIQILLFGLTISIPNTKYGIV